MMVKKTFLKKEKKNTKKGKKIEEGEGNSNWIKEKRRKPWHAASSWQMHPKKKLANGYDQMETWSWVIDKGVLW